VKRPAILLLSFLLAWVSTRGIMGALGVRHSPLLDGVDFRGLALELGVFIPLMLGSEVVLTRLWGERGGD